MKHTRYPMLLLCAAFAACTPVKEAINPVVAQLEEFQKATKAGDFKAIAGAGVTDDCAAQKPGCAKIYALHGDACLRVAMDGRASGAACPSASDDTRRLLACAAGDYKAGRAQPVDPEIDAAAQSQIHLNRAMALYCGAETAASSSAGDALASEAGEEAQGAPSPDAEWIAGQAQLFHALHGGMAVDKCAAVRRAAGLAQTGLASPGNDDQHQRLRRLSLDASQLRASLPGCGG